uniref:Trafficking protein particle complex subunit 5 n=2 Tax=Kryptolebias marmoratus TaxID=37003 RepID=A0A3Q3FPA2_KRYMA
MSFLVVATASGALGGGIHFKPRKRLSFVNRRRRKHGSNSNHVAVLSRKAVRVPPQQEMDTRFTRGKSTILERPLSRPKTEVSLSAFALLFSEMVQYCQSRVYSVSELQTRLADMGRRVGANMLDALVLREKNGKRETKVLNMLLFVKVNVWKSLFGKEADKLEQANDDDKTYYIIEKDSLVNTYISVPKENSSLNCAAFTAGVVEAILTHSGFPAKVTAHWHKGTTLMIKFNESVIARDKALDGR